MAISPINVSRLSQTMRTDFVLGSLRQNQLDVFRAQTQIATGRSFVTPSDDPVTASRVVDLTQALAQQRQFMSNLRHADSTLAAADSSINEVNSLLIEASTIASRNLSNLTSAAERASVADLIAGIRLQLRDVGNRQFNGRFLFAGRETIDAPFVEALGGIAYTGDVGDLVVRVGEGQSATINVPGNLLFGALSSRIGTTVDLSPAPVLSTRLDDLSGATGQGVRLGTLVFNEPDGAGAFQVDLGPADTIGDVIDLINASAAQAGSTLTASLTDSGLTVTPGGSAITVTDSSTGIIAADLGIRTTSPTSATIVGASLHARLTRLTSVDALKSGSGIDLSGGLVITNGPSTVNVDLSQAKTVQDIINAINNTGLFVHARINEGGTGIDLFNQVSGTSLTIGENGGTTASDLGLRTLDRDTPLTELNFGKGIITRSGVDDFRITAKSGQTLDINIDGAVTIGDVIDRINAAATTAGVAVSASLRATGNGIEIVDATTGSGGPKVSMLNVSEAAENLGLLHPVVSSATTVSGEDRNPVRTDGILDALVALESALRRDDTRAIASAAERIAPLASEVIRIHGVVGARSQSMQAKLHQAEDAAGATQIFLSELQDVDFAEAATRLQSAATRLQASLQTSSLLLNLSLLDFLS